MNRGPFATETETSRECAGLLECLGSEGRGRGVWRRQIKNLWNHEVFVRSLETSENTDNQLGDAHSGSRRLLMFQSPEPPWARRVGASRLNETAPLIKEAELAVWRVLAMPRRIGLVTVASLGCDL